MFDHEDYDYLMRSYDIPEGLDYRYSIYVKQQDQTQFKNVDLDKE